MTKTAPKWPPTTSMDAAGLYEPIKKMAELALRFSLVDRKTRLLNGSSESDTDHTVMLSWLALALAARCSDSLDMGLVAQFAIVHDAPEVLCGDISTLSITPAARAAKGIREEWAAEALSRMFGPTLPWFPEMILRYERREEPEAKFVWALDKTIVKIVNLLAGCHDITVQGLGFDDFVAMRIEQRPKLAREVGAADWAPGLLRVYDRLCAEVEARLLELALPKGVPDNAAALAVSKVDSGHVDFVCPGDHDDGRTCMFCDGGLFACSLCNSFEGATTTHCPGRKMTADQHDAVYAGDLDFRRKADGSGWWVRAGSPHTPNKGWVPRFEPDGQSIDDAIEWVLGRKP